MKKRPSYYINVFILISRFSKETLYMVTKHCFQHQNKIILLTFIAEDVKQNKYINNNFVDTNI